MRVFKVWPPGHVPNASADHTRLEDDHHAPLPMESFKRQPREDRGERVHGDVREMAVRELIGEPEIGSGDLSL